MRTAGEVLDEIEAGIRDLRAKQNGTVDSLIEFARDLALRGPIEVFGANTPDRCIQWISETRQRASDLVGIPLPGPAPWMDRKIITSRVSPWSRERLMGPWPGHRGPDFSARAENCIVLQVIPHGLDTWRKIAEAEDLRWVKNLGPKSRREIKEELESAGLSVRWRIK